MLNVYIDSVPIAKSNHFHPWVTDDRTLNKRLHEYKQELKSVTHTYNASAKAINAVERNII